MTTSNISPSYLPSLYSALKPTSASPATVGFALPPAPPIASNVASTTSPSHPVQDPLSDPVFQSALAKLQQTDPSLTTQIQAFQSNSQPTPTNAVPTASTAIPSQSFGTPLSGAKKAHGHHHHGGSKESSAAATNSSALGSVPTSSSGTIAKPTASNLAVNWFVPLKGVASYIQSQTPDFTQSLFAATA